MKARVSLGINLPTGDGFIDAASITSLDWRIIINGVAEQTGIPWVEVFVQDANHQKMTYGIYGAALTIMKDFVLTYPLYADASYFQIGDSKWGTVGNGYVGIGLADTTNTTHCYLKGNPLQNTGVICSMPSDYPDN